MYQIIKQIILITISIVVVKCKPLNQSILIEQLGYSKDSIQIDLSAMSLDSIDLETFNGFNNVALLINKKKKKKH